MAKSKNRRKNFYKKKKGKKMTDFNTKFLNEGKSHYFSLRNDVSKTFDKLQQMIDIYHSQEWALDTPIKVIEECNKRIDAAVEILQTGRNDLNEVNDVYLTYKADKESESPKMTTEDYNWGFIELTNKVITIQEGLIMPVVELIQPAVDAKEAFIKVEDAEIVTEESNDGK